MVRPQRLTTVSLLAWALLAAGCLAPSETLQPDEPHTPADPARLGSESEGRSGGEDPPPAAVPEEATHVPPDIQATLAPLPATRPETIHVEAHFALERAATEVHTLWLHWQLDGATIAVEALSWGADDGVLRTVTRTHPAPGGPATLQLGATWDDAATAAAQAEVRVVVPAGIRLILNASAQYTNDVGQPSFHSDWTIPLYPWDDESALDVLDRASLLRGFPYDAVYHADMDAHYIRMINGTKEVWLDPLKLVSRSWMIVHNGSLAGAGADHLIPAADDVIEFRYVQCYFTGQCDGVA